MGAAGDARADSGMGGRTGCLGPGPSALAPPQGSRRPAVVCRRPSRRAADAPGAVGPGTVAPIGGRSATWDQGPGGRRRPVLHGSGPQRTGSGSAPVGAHGDRGRALLPGRRRLPASPPVAPPGRWAVSSPRRGASPPSSPLTGRRAPRITKGPAAVGRRGTACAAPVGAGRLPRSRGGRRRRLPAAGGWSRPRSVGGVRPMGGRHGPPRRRRVVRSAPPEDGRSARPRGRERPSAVGYPSVLTPTGRFA